MTTANELSCEDVGCPCANDAASATAAHREALEICVTALSALPQIQVGRTLASLAAFFGLRYERSDAGFRSSTYADGE